MNRAVLCPGERPFVRISPRDSLPAELYQQEHAVALRLARQVAELTAQVNGGNRTFWRVIYDQAHVAVARERQG